MSGPQGDVCPLCRHVGMYLIPPPFSVECLCTNNDCDLFMWDATATHEELMYSVVQQSDRQRHPR